MLWKDPVFWKMLLGVVALSFVACAMSGAWYLRREDQRRLREGRVPSTYERWGG